MTEAQIENISRSNFNLDFVNVHQVLLQEKIFDVCNRELEKLQLPKLYEKKIGW